MRYLLWVGIICLIVLEGCTRSEIIDAGSAVRIVVDVSKSKVQNLSDEAEITEIIPLETVEKSLLRNIDKLYVTDQYILVVDLRKSEIYLFDRDGRFRNKIGIKGRGPKEYIAFDDVQYDERNGLIYIHERMRHRMQSYGTNGKLINEKEYHQWLDSFLKTDDGYWIYTCYNEDVSTRYALQLIDSAFKKVVGQYLPQKCFFTTTFLPRFFQDGQGGDYFAYPYSNIIYRLENGIPEPYLTVDFGEKTLPYEEIKQLKEQSEYEKLVLDKGYLGDLKNMFFCNGKFYFSFSELASGETTLYRAVYDMNTSEVEIYDRYAPFCPSGLQRYAFKKLPLTELLGTDGKSLIYSVYPYNLSEENLRVLTEKVSPEINQEANPLLFFVRQK